MPIRINIICYGYFWLLGLVFFPNFVLLEQGSTHTNLACSRCCFLFFFFLNGAQMLVRIKVTPNTFYIAIFQTE